MFRPLPMKRVRLQMLRDDAPAAAVVLARSGVFNPDTATVPDDALGELPAELYREVYSHARGRFEKIRGTLRCTTEPMQREPRAVELNELEQVNERLGTIWRDVSALEEQQRRLLENRKAVNQQRETLRNFAALEVDLGDLQGPKQFIDLHVGTIPRENLERLTGAVALAGYFVRPFRTTEELVYVVVAGPQDAREEVAGLLHAAEFRVLRLPPEFTDYPERIEQHLSEQAAELDRELTAKQHEIEEVAKRHHEELERACQLLATAAPYAELANKLRGQGGLVLVEGWIPAAEVRKLQQALHEQLDRPFVMTTRDPLPEELARVPTVIQHSPLLRPFVALVKGYGIPRYGEFDPTVLFALTFVAMFGMMFGDIGHGAVIALAGIVVRRRFPTVVPFLVAAGASSMLFGLLYGSVFGYEEVVHPLWMSPLSDPLLMLQVALFWGIGFILLCCFLTLRNLIVQHRYAEALFDNRGAAGIALYLAGLHAGFSWVGRGEFGLVELVLLLVPLSVIIGFKWHEDRSPRGERVLVVLIEGFESVMNYLANTLSFLRVAAFSLNHVALAVAVFTLANMMGTAGHWITVVLGNLFIIGLEGAIVTIQVLRLEYYEGFSRFFSGDGREFKPLTLETPRGAKG